MFEFRLIWNGRVRWRHVAMAAAAAGAVLHLLGVVPMPTSW